MKLKTVTIDGKTFAEIEDGKPIYVYEDGKEIPFDAQTNVEKIKSLNAEAKGHREEKEAALTTLKKFEGIEDVDAARAALETVSNLDQGKLVAAGKVEEIKAAAKKAADEQVAEVRKGLEAQINQLTADLATTRVGWDNEKIGTKFSSSKFVADRLAVPGAVAQKIFGDNFKVEDGNLVGYIDGKKVYSRESPGDAAPFDEALSTMVDAYAFRDSIVRGSGGGSGGRGGGGGQGHGAKEITRGEFEQLSASDRNARMKDGFTIVDGG